MNIHMKLENQYKVVKQNEEILKYEQITLNANNVKEIQ